MEKFFIVTEKSSLYNEWFEYKENLKLVRELAKSFMTAHNIEAAEGYYVTDDAFYIMSSIKDAELFSDILCQPADHGLQRFKKTSKIGKAWIKSLKDAGLKVASKPIVIMYFNSFGGGKFRSRIFDKNGVIYCSVEPVHGETPKGFLEIKASEFYKIIESDVESS